MTEVASESRPMRPYRDNYNETTYADHLVVTLLRGLLIPRVTRLCVAAGTGRNALDVGCGRQPFREIIESNGLRYHAQDAVQNYERSVDYICRIDGELPADFLAAGPFDVVMCTEVLEHVADWPVAFENFSRLVAPGGNLLISCPHFYVLHEEPFDYWRPTKHAIRYFAEKNGFDVTEEIAAGSGWDVLGTLIGNTTVYPVKKRLWQRGVTKCVEWAMWLTYRLIRSHFLPRNVKWECQTYLTNVFQLTRRHA